MADIPSTHNLSTFIHNSFVNFLQNLKHRIQVSTTTYVHSPSSYNVRIKTLAISQPQQIFGLLTRQKRHSWGSLLTGSNHTQRVQAGHLPLGSLPFMPYQGLTLVSISAATFVNLCEHAGIITSQLTKVCPMKFSLFSNYLTLSYQLFCVTADNTSNDTACSAIENILLCKHIYSFDSNTQCLPCLAHIINLVITNFMSAVTHIASVEMTLVIWEFDPSISTNCIPGDSLNVVSTI